jgi:hypothetical protein
MATKPSPTGLSDEQAAILTSGNFVLHAVYQGGTDGYTRSAIYQPLYVVGVENGELQFLAEPVGAIRTMRALNLFENAPRDMPPMVIIPEVAETYPSFCRFINEWYDVYGSLMQAYEGAGKRLYFLRTAILD